MREPDTFYKIRFVDGYKLTVKVPPTVTSPMFAIEHKVPFFGWPPFGNGERFVINPATVTYVQEVPEPKEPF